MSINKCDRQEIEKKWSSLRNIPLIKTSTNFVRTPTLGTYESFPVVIGRDVERTLHQRRIRVGLENDVFQRPGRKRTNKYECSWSNFYDLHVFS